MSMKAKDGIVETLVFLGAPFIEGSVTLEQNRVTERGSVSIVSDGEIRSYRHRYVYTKPGTRGAYKQVGKKATVRQSHVAVVIDHQTAGKRRSKKRLFNIRLTPSRRKLFTKR